MPSEVPGAAHDPVAIADIPVGNGAPLVLIAGLNVIESEANAVTCAERVQDLAARHDLPFIFKASFDKANRSSVSAYRGPGLHKGLRILESVKKALGVPVTTDVHEPAQAGRVAGVADCLQIPAFLCRQTDLLAACAATGLPLNIKKGQFVAPRDITLAVQKAREQGARGILLTERGTTFGHNDLVVDMRGLVQMRRSAPVCFDATHSVQHPGAGDAASGGDRSFVAPLARAAAAIGIDALFVEVHENPAEAPCDGQCQIDYAALDALLTEVTRIDRALRAP